MHCESNYEWFTYNCVRNEADIWEMKRITCSALNMMNVPGWNDLINGNIVICSSGACCKLLLSHLQGYDQRRRGLEDWQNQSLSQGTLGVIFLCTNCTSISVYIPVNLISKGIKVIFVIILNIHYRSKVGGQKDFYLKKLILLFSKDALN